MKLPVLAEDLPRILEEDRIPLDVILRGLEPNTSSQKMNTTDLTTFSFCMKNSSSFFVKEISMKLRKFSKEPEKFSTTIATISTVDFFLNTKESSEKQKSK